MHNYSLSEVRIQSGLQCPLKERSLLPGSFLPMSSASWCSTFSSELLHIFECYFINFMFLAHLGHLIKGDIGMLTYNNAEVKFLSQCRCWLSLANSFCLICSLWFVIPWNSQSVEMWVSWLFVYVCGDLLMQTSIPQQWPIKIPKTNQKYNILTRSGNLTLSLLPSSVPYSWKTLK